MRSRRKAAENNETQPLGKRDRKHPALRSAPLDRLHVPSNESPGHLPNAAWANQPVQGHALPWRNNAAPLPRQGKPGLRRGEQKDAWIAPPDNARNYVPIGSKTWLPFNRPPD